MSSGRFFIRRRCRLWLHKTGDRDREEEAPLSGMTCGEALIGLLEAYGVDTVFGIPGVHTLEF